MKRLGNTIKRMKGLADSDEPIRQETFEAYAQILSGKIEPVVQETTEVMEVYFGFMKEVMDGPTPVYVSINTYCPPMEGCGASGGVNFRKFESFSAMKKAEYQEWDIEAQTTFTIITEEEYQKGEDRSWDRDQEEIERGKAEAELRSTERRIYGEAVVDAWEAEKDMKEGLES